MSFVLKYFKVYRSTESPSSSGLGCSRICNLMRPTGNTPDKKLYTILISETIEKKIDAVPLRDVNDNAFSCDTE